MATMADFLTATQQNKIRMAIDREYYHDEVAEGERNWRLHVGKFPDPKTLQGPLPLSPPLLAPVPIL